MNQIILKGNFVFSLSPNEIKTYSNSYIVVTNGIVDEIYSKLPEHIKGTSVIDYGNQLIIPGFTDLHVHASQFYQRGLGMDYELLTWLEKHTFCQESQFSNLDYAKNVYTEFVNELTRQGTLHACIWATIHKDATDLLFEILSKKGLKAYVGKVNIDQHCPPSLTEDRVKSIYETEELIVKYKDNPFVKPILTPRFVPTCSKDLLKELGNLAIKYNIPVQSHLSENKAEVNWVKKLHPEVKTYSEVYKQNGLLGPTPTLMAHCIYLEDEDKKLIKESNATAIHCPESNMNLTSGIMPVKKLLKEGLKIGLGTDIGAGHSLSMPQAIVRAIQLSKILKSIAPVNEALAFEEVFYMATKGNGGFWGNIGSFEKGYSFDALVINDSCLGKQDISLLERLQRFIYIGDDRNITTRFVNGNIIE